MTPEQTQELARLRANLTQLNGLLASGLRTAILEGQQVTYNTTASLIEARDDVQAQINTLLGQVTGPRSRQSYAYQSGRGYDR